MFKHRVEKIVSKMSMPGYLVTNSSDLFYLTGVNLDGFWLLLSKDGPVIFSSKLLAGQLSVLLPGTKILEGDKLISLVWGFCRENRIRILGVDPGKISYALGMKLNRNNPPVSPFSKGGIKIKGGYKLRIKYVSGSISKFREIKDDFEIETIRKSCKIAKEALKYARKLARPGITEETLSLIIEEFFIKKGVKPSFPTIVASGPNTANPHHISSNRRITKDDVVLIDLGCIYKGYCSDLTRTFFLGKINRFKEQIYSIVNKAHESAIKEMQPGRKACDIDKAARALISKQGFGAEFVHSTGHGVGIDIHESPRISKKDRTILKPGMVVTIEPGIYLPGQFGVRIEDTIVVTIKGNEVLTE